MLAGLRSLWPKELSSGGLGWAFLRHLRRRNGAVKINGAKARGVLNRSRVSTGQRIRSEAITTKPRLMPVRVQTGTGKKILLGQIKGKVSVSNVRSIGTATATAEWFETRTVLAPVMRPVSIQGIRATSGLKEPATAVKTSEEEELILILSLLEW